jgi:Domain of unknown function (DUF5666)
MTMDPTQPVTPATPATPVTPPAGPDLNPAPIPAVAVAPRQKAGGILNLLLIGAAILAVGGVAFAIGRTTAPASAFPGVGRVTDGGTVLPPDGSFAPGAGGPAGLVLGGTLAVDGTVKSIDADSVTLTLENGEDITFELDASTTYRAATDASAADVAVGDQVSVKVAGGGRLELGEDGAAPDLRADDVTVAR